MKQLKYEHSEFQKKRKLSSIKKRVKKLEYNLEKNEDYKELERLKELMSVIKSPFSESIKDAKGTILEENLRKRQFDKDLDVTVRGTDIEINGEMFKYSLFHKEYSECRFYAIKKKS